MSSGGSAIAHGWRRAFCLGWDRRFRGNAEQPGLMLALDRGGELRGVVYRLPEETLDAKLERVLRREMLILPSPFPPRWITVMTRDGTAAGADLRHGPQQRAICRGARR